MKLVEHGLGEDSADLLPWVVFFRELNDVEELLELRVLFIDGEQAVLQGEVDSRLLCLVEYELAECEELVMHGHADEMLRDENRAVAQRLVSEHERIFRLSSPVFISMNVLMSAERVVKVYSNPLLRNSSWIFARTGSE